MLILIDTTEMGTLPNCASVYYPPPPQKKHFPYFALINPYDTVHGSNRILAYIAHGYSHLCTHKCIYIYMYIYIHTYIEWIIVKYITPYVRGISYEGKLLHSTIPDCISIYCPLVPSTTIRYHLFQPINHHYYLLIPYDHHLRLSILVPSIIIIIIQN